MARTLAQPATLAAAQERPRRRDWHGFTAHVILIASVALLAFPLYYAFVISTQTLSQVTTTPPKPWPSTALLANYAEAWHRAQMGRMLVNSAIVALGVAIGKIVISLLSAFAIVYFDFRGKNVVFWMIFVTLMLPVPVRIVSTYQVVSVLGWVNTYWGLTVPLMASATGGASTIMATAIATFHSGSCEVRGTSVSIPITAVRISGVLVIIRGHR